MLKTELIQRVADMNPHLRASDAEKIVNTIFEEMIDAIARATAWSYVVLGRSPCE